MADQQSPFLAVCPDCDVETEAATFDDSAAFASKHREHTGHVMRWERADFGDLVPETAWELACDTCEETWTFDGEGAALAFREEHAEYTDHAIESDPVHRGATADSEEAVAALIRDLSDRFDGGVPEPVVHAQAGEADRETVRRRLQRLKDEGTVFEPSPFRLQAV